MSRQSSLNFDRAINSRKREGRSESRIYDLIARFRKPHGACKYQPKTKITFYCEHLLSFSFMFVVTMTMASCIWLLSPTICLRFEENRGNIPLFYASFVPFLSHNVREVCFHNHEISEFLMPLKLKPEKEKKLFIDLSIAVWIEMFFVSFNPIREWIPCWFDKSTCYHVLRTADRTTISPCPKFARY